MNWKKSTFRVSKMDCPGEERLVRMKLDSLGSVRHLEFDLPQRTVSVYHDGDHGLIGQALASLELGSTLLQTKEVPAFPPGGKDGEEKRVLRAVLLINFGFFVIEAAAGFVARSMGLAADSLDMLADALVYGLALSAVGGAAAYKKKIVKISGFFQLGLAIAGLSEVVRRFLGAGEIPSFKWMIVISILALIGNYASLLILQRSKSQEVHIKASQIFTSNDILANIGVILAGLLVYVTNSRYPDLIAGSIIFLIVVRGSYRILQLSK